MTTTLPTTPPKGRLYLVPAPLDFGCATQAPLQDALPLGTLQVAAGITHWICENAKSARAYLKRIDAVVPLAAPIQSQQIDELPREVHKKGDHAGQFDARPVARVEHVAGQHQRRVVLQAGIVAPVHAAVPADGQRMTVEQVAVVPELYRRYSIEGWVDEVLELDDIHATVRDAAVPAPASALQEMAR